MTEDHRRSTIRDYLVDRYEEIRNGTATHLEVMVDAVELTVQLAQGFYSGQTPEEGAITEMVIGDLQAVFIGNGLTDPTGRGEGPHWYGNGVGIEEGRRGATGFDEQFHGRDDQVQHTIGGVVGAYGYNSLFEWYAMLQENNDADYQINLQTFAIGNSLNDGNIDQLPQLLQDSLDPVGTPPTIMFTDGEAQCFPSGTPIRLWNGTTKPIEAITQSDIVLTHDAQGNPVPGIVDKLFTNTTQEFVRLTFADGRDDLVATPGHRFLTETGDYMEIGHMLRLGGGTVRLTDTDGSIVEATGEVITYSTETAHLFEQSATKTIALHGNTVLKEQAAQGWQTYNFEVREHHNYVAGGIRVHNDSVLSHLQAGDSLQALSSDLRDAIVLRDVDGDGTQEIVFIDGFEGTGGDTILQGEYVIYSATDIPFGIPLDLEAWLLEQLTADPALATTPEAIALLLNLLPTVETYSESFGAPSADGIVTGTTGNDLIDAAYADIDGDQITGDADRLLGLDGNDTLIGGAGADSLDGGAGVDTASYAGAGAGVIADLRGVQAQTGDALGDVFTGIENLTGSGFDDALYGDNSGNLLIGGAGDDTLRPTGGDDTVIGGDGDDVIYAHTGQDVIEGNAGNDTLQGGEGDDTLTGGAGADWIDGGDGLDYASFADASAGVRLDLLGLVAALGDAAGDTVQNIEGVIGSDHDDTLYGDNAANHLIGGLGDDRLYGRGGGDTVDGGAGNDRLFGNGVQDIMIGGAGADVFGFNNEADSRNGIDNRDTIVDFETGVDVIDLGNVDADISTADDDSFTFLGLTGSFTGNAGELRYARSVANDLTLIQIDTDGDALADMQIELTGLHDLTAGDFIL